MMIADGYYITEEDIIRLTMHTLNCRQLTRR